jgi:hypothetical protein
MKKWVVAGAVALVAIAGGAYYAAVVLPDQQVRAALDASIAKLPPSYSAKYTSAHYSIFDKILTISGLTLDSPAAPEFHMSIDKITIDHPSPEADEAWRKAKAAPAEIPSDLTLAVVREIKLAGITLRFPSGSATVGEIRYSGLRIFPQALVQLDASEFANAALITNNPGQPPDLNALRPILRAEAALLMGVAYDGGAVSDLAIKIKVPQQPTEIAVTLKSLVVGAGERGIFAGGSAEGMTESLGAMGAVRLNRMTAGAADFRDALVKLLGGAALDATLLDKLSFDGFRYEGVEVATPTTGVIKLGAFTVGKVQFAGGLPVTASVGFEKLHLIRAQLAIAGPNNPLDRLGLDAITISLSAGFAWDVAGQHIALKDTSLKVDELGELSLAADIGNAGRDMSRAVLTHAAITYRDGSLTDRMIGMAAKQQKLDTAVMRQQLVAMVQQKSSPIAKTPAGQAIAQAIATFLQKPKSLMIDLAPPQPILLTALQTLGQQPPLAILQAVGPTVTANR